MPTRRGGEGSMRRSRTLIDTVDNKLYFMGPGQYDLETMLPAGTVSVQCHTAPSGHMMLPVDAYEGLDNETLNGGLELEQEMALPVASATPATSSQQ